MHRTLRPLLALALLLPASALAATPFGDVPTTHFAYEHILNLSERGLVGGFPDGTFQPDARVTRAEVLKLVCGAAGVKPATGGISSFSDVPATHSLLGYIEAAKQAGITSGFEDGTFRPDTTATRGQTLKLLLTAMALVGPAPTAAPFKDVTLTSPFAAAIASAKTLGIAGGFEDGTFRPDTNLTRAQAAKFTYNALLVKEGKPLPHATAATVQPIEQQLFQLINASRKEAGRPALQLNGQLSEIARRHAQDLYDTYKSFEKDGWAAQHPNEIGPWISHESGDGTTFEARLKRALADVGIVASGATENVGWATYNARSPEDAVRVIHEAMMAEVAPDDGHKQNILGQTVDVTEVGIGIVVGTDPREVYVTTDFIKR